MKKIFLVFILLFFPILGVSASSISSIDMDIFVDIDGDAVVTEKWNANVTEGTEGWHPYYNLGNSEISDLLVSMDGKEYTTISDWDIDNSFSDKAYKAGIYYPSSDEVDICFGISSYGEHEYIIQYQISNFVSTLDDADMIYWNLFPYDFSAEPDDVKITIYSDFLYDDNIELYGYGKYGAYNQLNNGKIVIDSMGSVDKDEYLTILVKFPKDTFQTDNILDNDFKFYYDMAEEGAITYKNNQKLGNSFLNLLHELFSRLIFFIVFLFPFFLTYFIYYFFRSDRFLFKSSKTGIRYIGDDVAIFRDIPCNNDIYRAYWLANSYNLVDSREDFLGTILLKWLYDGNIKIEKKVEDRKSEANIVFVKRPVSEFELEGKLYDSLSFSKLENKLYKDKYHYWNCSNCSKILSWFGDILFFETMLLLRKGQVTCKRKSKTSIFNCNDYEASSLLKEEAFHLAGLKKFLNEFTTINTKSVIEVKLWKEYLMYAQMFGIADKVSEQFEKFYPDIVSEMNYFGYTYDDFDFIRSATDEFIVLAREFKNKEELRYSNSGDNHYSSSDSGFSSGGGGIGASGSGSGGGGFR